MRLDDFRLVPLGLIYFFVARFVTEYTYQKTTKVGMASNISMLNESRSPLYLAHVIVCNEKIIFACPNQSFATTPHCWL